MVAVDTNLVVRLLTNDEPKQAKRAAEIFRSGQIFISKTVLLETEWVLRYSYELDRASIDRSLRNVLGLPNVFVESEEQVSQALGWFSTGFDFADALHVASSSGAFGFVTFDERLVKRAKDITTPGVGLA
jgi:predicted nucleic-acid-binding protein